MVQLVLNITTNMSVIALMVFKESNVKISSIGVLKVHAKMEQLVFSRRMNSDATVHQDGREKCVMLKWFLAETLDFAKKSI
jgi:hypothetical protein